MKKPWLAFLLSFLCAGLGLAYLGKYGWALLNFFGLVLVGLALAVVIPGDWVQPVGIGLCAASGGLAMAVAQSLNAKLRAAGTAVAGGPSGPPSTSAFVPGPAGRAATPDVAPGPNATRRFCAECGARTDDAKFCPECGQRQRPRDECASCGAKLHAGSRFCAECGGQVA